MCGADVGGLKGGRCFRRWISRGGLLLGYDLVAVVLGCGEGGEEDALDHVGEGADFGGRAGVADQVDFDERHVGGRGAVVVEV